MFNFFKLQVRKQVPSKVKLENGYNHAMLIIRKSDLLAFGTIVRYVIHNCLSFATSCLSFAANLYWILEC